MPSKKKKYNARFPPARIKKIMQTDDEVGKVAAAVPVIISRSLELFVESLITKANDITQARNAKTLTTLHLKQCILAENKFDFLKDLVASVPDVQVEDETSNPSVNPMILSGNINDDVSKIPSTKPRLQRRKKSKNNKFSAENNAGPSNSDEDDEEDSDEDDEDDEDSNEEENNNEDDETLNEKSRHIIRGPEIIQSNMEFKINRPTMMTSMNSDDEDYDS